MKRRTRTLVFLFATVVLFGSAVYVEVARERALALDPLTRIDTTAVRTLAVDCIGCTSRRFEKVDGHWQMRAPFARAADDARIAKLVAIATAPVRFRHAADSFDPRKLGLDPPQATLQLDDMALHFGTTDAIHGDRYVRVGDTIALVPDRFSALLFGTPQSELAAPLETKD
jgi:hypothetical protein